MNWDEGFIFKGKRLSYNRITSNNWGERAIEIPIAFNFLANLDNKGNILEVGNVLSNYENSLSEYLGIKPRRIVDKFEIDINVDNVDLMDIPPEEKYDAIVSISTVEHIGQGVAPAEAYGEQTTVRDLEAPLKAIAKIYDLLIVGGKALITVPFGKLTDGVWYIQFGWDYLELLETQYNIPQKAISTVFMKRLALEITEINSNNPNNPRQIWVEERQVNKLSNILYNFPWPYANAIAILELTKIEELFIQKSTSHSAHFNYEKAIPSPIIYKELLENNFLKIFDKLNNLNIIFFPICENEEIIFADLEKITWEFFNHPDRSHITLLIYTSNISEEEANVILAAASLSALMNSNLDETDGAEICLVGELSDVQWSALLPCIGYRIAIENGNRQDFSKSRTTLYAEEMPSCSIESFRTKRTVQSETGTWFLR